MRRDPRDGRQVFIEVEGVWHALPWNGLPPEGTVPAFGDARIREVLKEAARNGLKPRTDAELLPVLLDLLAEVTPVKGWPGRPEARKKAAARARELARARAAATDRPEARPPQPPSTGPSDPGRKVAAAVTADRRRRRTAAAAGARPVAAPPLGDALAARPLYPAARPATDEEDGSETVEPATGQGPETEGGAR